MSSHIRSILLSLFSCLVLLGAGSATGAPREQFLVPDSMPMVARGGKGNIALTTTFAPTSIIRQFAFYAP